MVRPEVGRASFWFYKKEFPAICLRPSLKRLWDLSVISVFGLASREEVDTVAFEAKKDNLLKFGPTFLNPYAGYLCIVSDPDGHMVEFSHGQALGNSPAGSKSATPGQ